MELAHTHAQSQRYLKQRNMLAFASLLLLGATVLLSTAAANTEREVILQPILSKPLALTSSATGASLTAASVTPAPPTTETVPSWTP